MIHFVRQLSSAAVMLTAFAVAVPGSLRAQGGEGFLFGQPRVSLKFESGYGWQSASSDVYDWVIGEHTIGRRDFDAPYLGGELGLRATEHVDVAIAVGYQASSVRSEYREYIGTDDLPILQNTRLRQIPAVASLKLYPFARGRQIGRFAWVPRAFAPFVGGGVGLVMYSFEQQGEFVDYETLDADGILDIFNDRITSEGEAFLVRAQAGFNISLGKQFVLTFEGRYNWSNTPLEGGWVDFRNIDLDGLQAIGGLAIRW